MSRLPKFARPVIILVAVLLLFMLIYMTVSFFWKGKEPQYAPDITGVTADGSSLYSLSDNRGKTGTVLIFFNHNTGKAVELMQQLSAVAPEYDADVMAVATGEGTVEEQLAVMKEKEIPVFAHSLFDLEGEMAKVYNVTGTPVTYFIDKNGVIQEVFISSISEKSLRKWLAAIA